MALYLITGIAASLDLRSRGRCWRGEQVRGVDNFSTGKRENLHEILPQIDFREADILDLDAMHKACAGVDYVLHQAAIPSVPKSVLDPIASNRANVDGTVNVLVAARDAKVKRVVYAASSSAYGDTPTCPSTKHDTGSDLSLRRCQAGQRTLHDFVLPLLRIGNRRAALLQHLRTHQDPSSQYSGVLAKFITQMLRGEQPTIYGDGEQSRDFTYIDNAVEANLLACHAPAQAAGKVFNVATGRRVTLNETFSSARLTSYKGSA
jgi:UDP-glucose 4-epimerase